MSSVNLTDPQFLVDLLTFTEEILNGKLPFLYSDNSDQSSKIDDIRSSHTEVFCKKSVFRNFAKFTGKQLCPSLFFNKVAGLRGYRNGIYWAKTD